MPTTILLEQRLAEIGQSLKTSGKALALLGLGSVGKEKTCLDEYSDLDFFVIAKPGCKQCFLDDDLFWLEQCAQSGFFFRNTVDGYKFLYEDGVFCEFAVFETKELEHIPFSEGRAIWSEPEFNLTALQPKTKKGMYQRSSDIEWILGEALTNLYVGMCRHNRGEKLSGMRFVQSHALDRILDLIQVSQVAENIHEDPYLPERRFEMRYPEAKDVLGTFCQGYEKNAVSALAQLVWLESNYSINSTIAREIRRLITDVL